MDLVKNALSILEATSRTFYIPISQLPAHLREAVASAYLCMRAIDEIEDHPHLDGMTKAKLLRQLSLNLQAGTERAQINDFAFGLTNNHHSPLPEVSLRIGEWGCVSPANHCSANLGCHCCHG